ncbi:MAG: sugar phosphate nucleotidyltransferase [Sphaerochaetaceae bacterium]|jgi:CTP:phosphocholine cytidylyltransferase-like protein
MNEVTHAIIMAAGIGERLRPITNTLPKPLVPVQGTSMIETIILSLLKNRITPIYVVVGHLKNEFTFLQKKYPSIILIDNPYYSVANNISSLYVAKSHIPNAIIIDGDQIINNSKILDPKFEKSGYNCVWTDEHTDEWLLQAADGVVTTCSRNGGQEGWQLYSISRWSKEDGEKLQSHVEILFKEKENWNLYWDDIALFKYFSEYSLGIYPMQSGDIVEIDTLEELQKLDPSYSSK